jgi:protease-4
MREKKTKTNSFFGVLKNLFILLIFLQFAPTIVSNLKEQITEAISPKTHIGHITIKGMLSNSTFYVKKIREFHKDETIKALLLKIDCPGGLPGSAQAIFNELQYFKKDKPIVTLTENICTSAAYYIAAASNCIIAPASALVGGIGVFLQIPNVKELLEHWKITFQFIQKGEYKTAGSPLKDQTPAELTYLQGLADGNYVQFTKDVATSRNILLKQEKIWANGKVFLGTEGKRLGLIDVIGSYQEAEDAIKKLAKIPTSEEIKLIAPKRPSPFARLFGGDEDYGSSSELSSKTASFLHDVYAKFFEKQISPFPYPKAI